MGISGMTGFARVSGEAEWGNWYWEARSVNGRGLDLRMNLPSGLEPVEQSVRKAASELLDRGNLQIALRIDLSSGEDVVVNESVLQTLISAYERAEGALATGPALATLMTVKGVVEAENRSVRDLVEIEGAIDALTATGHDVLSKLRDSRIAEGDSLTKLLVGQLSEMEKLTRQASEFSDIQKEAIAEKYRGRISEFDTEGIVSDERLVTEIAVLAAKADVTEELDRLEAHVARGLSMLDAGGAVGRDLGFLAQELNREANTLCSKSASLDLTNVGLALKSTIDQFKEQAANVE
ncbi:MAG: YicC/YloC family endoribonuclease [Pseudomonadota bacterium]|nr:YicC/YloC family endoribonuclease [Pseudomonadota bacterium]